MSRRRMPREEWETNVRPIIWKRDGGICQSPPGPHKAYCVGIEPMLLTRCHIDHIKPVSCGGTNAHNNLRTLCKVCHALRSEQHHRSMVRKLLKDGTIPPDWHKLVWDD